MPLSTETTPEAILEAGSPGSHRPGLRLYSLDYTISSSCWFRRLQPLDGAAWLDSGEPGHYNSRYDIVTALPRQQVCQTSEQQIRILHRDGRTEQRSGSLLDYLQDQLTELGLPSSVNADMAGAGASAELPFTGGAIGYLGYESQHDSFGLNSPIGDASLPNLYFGIYDWALIIDHQQQSTTLCVLEQCPNPILARVQRALASAEPELGDYRCSALTADVERHDYMNAVAAIKRYIYAGDCYQVNFAQRFSGVFQGSTAAAYNKLRKILPGPFSAYLATPAGTLLSFSPERFLEVDGRRIRTQPIKGTAPRGETPAEDQALAHELQTSAKNRAENVMIVDLLRNDLSKVCEPFSVEVPELFGLQSFANVHHLVSTVTGRLRETCNWLDALQACFPGGSITGAPKKRAMEIINELEHHERSVYCGSIFYVSLNGRMDSNIAIRTLVQKEERVYCWGGGGIVADSDPDLEYQECLHKVGTLLRAVATK